MNVSPLVLVFLVTPSNLILVFLVIASSHLHDELVFVPPEHQKQLNSCLRALVMNSSSYIDSSRAADSFHELEIFVGCPSKKISSRYMDDDRRRCQADSALELRGQAVAMTSLISLDSSRAADSFYELETFVGSSSKKIDHWQAKDQQLAKREIVFIDECTCHPWHKAGMKTWMRPSDPIYLRLAANRGSSVAVMGAISNRQPEFKYGAYDRNNKVSFLEFLRSIEAWPRKRKNTVYVLDGATYHNNREVKEYLHSIGVSLLFLPPSSSELNPIGTSEPSLLPFPFLVSTLLTFICQEPSSTVNDMNTDTAPTFELLNFLQRLPLTSKLMRQVEKNENATAPLLRKISYVTVQI